jgi:hypothetical protein
MSEILKGSALITRCATAAIVSIVGVTVAAAMPRPSLDRQITFRAEQNITQVKKKQFCYTQESPDGRTKRVCVDECDSPSGLCPVK